MLINSNQNLIYYGAFQILIWFLFTLVCLSDPGKQVKKQEKNEQVLLKNLYDILQKYDAKDICPECICIKASRSKHCDICQSCILVYDHHFPWVDNCVQTTIFSFIYLSFAQISLLLQHINFILSLNQFKIMKAQNNNLSSFSFSLFFPSLLCYYFSFLCGFYYIFKQSIYQQDKQLMKNILNLKNKLMNSLAVLATIVQKCVVIIKQIVKIKRNQINNLYSYLIHDIIINQLTWIIIITFQTFYQRRLSPKILPNYVPLSIWLKLNSFKFYFQTLTDQI